MKVLQEFRQFIQRGNVIDLAVGVIMGTAFTKIVNSLVSDVVMPPIGFLIGGVSFKDLKVTLPSLKLADTTLPPAEIKYGQFLQNTFEFILIAGCVFLLVKGINILHRRLEGEPTPAAAPPPTPTEKLLIEIRDLLQASNSKTASAPEKTGENPPIQP